MFLFLFLDFFSICPGMHLAERVVFHFVTTVIALYQVVPLEGCKIPDPNSIEYTATEIQYVI